MNLHLGITFDGIPMDEIKETDNHTDDGAGTPKG